MLKSSSVMHRWWSYYLKNKTFLNCRFYSILKRQDSIYFKNTQVFDWLTGFGWFKKLMAFRWTVTIDNKAELTRQLIAKAELLLLKTKWTQMISRCLFKYHGCEAGASCRMQMKITSGVWHHAHHHYSLVHVSTLSCEWKGFCMFSSFNMQCAQCQGKAEMTKTHKIFLLH